MTTEQRRVAERILLSPELDAKLADTPGRIGEIATLGCRFEHSPRLAIGTSMWLRLTWENQPIAVQTKIVWSELKLSGGDKFYYSGLQFGDGDAAQLEMIRVALGKYLTRVLSAKFPELPLAAKRKPSADSVPFMAKPFISAGGAPAAPKTTASGYLEFHWFDGRWDRQETAEPSQPRDGLTFPAAFDQKAIEIWQRRFEGADEPVRRMLRAALELRIG